MNAAATTGSAVEALLRPSSIAIVGASDRSRWSILAFENLTRRGSNIDLKLVNRHGGQVHGRAAAESCAALGESVDLGVVLVPKEGVVSALADLGIAKARSAVILTSGFAEAGAAGRDLQQKVADAARENGIRLLGPNCLGYINFVNDVQVWTTPVRSPSRRDGVAIISQSGATALFLSDLAHNQDIGLSYVISTGNEADLDIAAFIEHLIDDPATRAIALFIETIRHPDRFVAAARRALERGKPIVVLKVGASEATARAAQAHTGALVGDDRAFDGVCRQFGLIRVRSLEEMIATANVLAHTGELRAGGLCVVSNSGGISEIAADTAHLKGVDLPQASARARAEVAANMPDYATANNPLDVTGGIEPGQCGAVIDILGRQPEYAAILCPWYEIPTHEDQIVARTSELHRQLSAALKRASIPGFLVSYTHTQITDFSRGIIDEIGAPYLACGLDRAISGVAGAMWWSERRRKRASLVEAPREALASPWCERPRSEREALAFLAAAGVPTAPTTWVRDADDAVAAARALGGPIVLKIASPDIAHKSDIGGVALNLQGDEAVAAAFRRVTASASAAAPAARLEGALLMPMRERGVELLIGCARDPEWGWVLAVGLGGVFVEVMKDVSLRLLPASEGIIKEMLGELKGAKLLEGQRGIPAADIDAVARAARRIGEAALGCGDDLVALEVNPLWVRGGHVEALDAVFVWRDAPGAS